MSGGCAVLCALPSLLHGCECCHRCTNGKDVLIACSDVCRQGALLPVEAAPDLVSYKGVCHVHCPLQGIMSKLSNLLAAVVHVPESSTCSQQQPPCRSVGLWVLGMVCFSKFAFVTWCGCFTTTATSLWLWLFSCRNETRLPFSFHRRFVHQGRCYGHWNVHRLCVFGAVVCLHAIWHMPNGMVLRKALLVI